MSRKKNIEEEVSAKAEVIVEAGESAEVAADTEPSEIKNDDVDIIEEKSLTEEAIAREIKEKEAADEIKTRWVPKTDLGKKVKEGMVADIDFILDRGMPIFETPIVDILLPDLENDLLMIGQAKGKFGGGQKRIFRQTQKKTAEGNKPNFAVCAVVGNKDGYVGIGYGKSKETVPARDKALRNAKLNIRKIRRGCGSWECGCKEPHSIPYAVTGRCGSIQLDLIPAPKGKGLVVPKEIQKILGLAGIKDVWSRSFGDTRTSLNVIYACVDAMDKLVQMKIKAHHSESLGMCEGTKKAI